MRRGRHDGGLIVHRRLRHRRRPIGPHLQPIQPDPRRQPAANLLRARREFEIPEVLQTQLRITPRHKHDAARRTLGADLQTQKSDSNFVFALRICSAPSASVAA
jgi:hypothetical protein